MFKANKWKLPFSICGIPETWKHGHGKMKMETSKHGDIDMRHGNMETWTWRHRHGDMEFF
jgi:hypothetical protein